MRRFCSACTLRGRDSVRAVTGDEIVAWSAVFQAEKTIRRLSSAISFDLANGRILIFAGRFNLRKRFALSERKSYPPNRAFHPGDAYRT